MKIRSHLLKVNKQGGITHPYHFPRTSFFRTVRLKIRFHSSSCCSGVFTKRRIPLSNRSMETTLRNNSSCSARSSLQRFSRPSPLAQLSFHVANDQLLYPVIILNLHIRYSFYTKARKLSFGVIQKPIIFTRIKIFF